MMSTDTLKNWEIWGKNRESIIEIVKRRLVEERRERLAHRGKLRGQPSKIEFNCPCQTLSSDNS
jgi:hypothetical protein